MRPMSNPMIYKNLFLIAILLLVQPALAASIVEEKMQQLQFMVGEWVGTSSVYTTGVKDKEVSAFQSIQYDLSKHILVINLNSELLQLHTIIKYDETDATYYYYPFSKTAARKLKAELKHGQLVVHGSAENRFIFSQTSSGGFREYGERFIDGSWVKYFEDNFINTQ